MLDTFLLNTVAQLPLLFFPPLFFLVLESCRGNLEGSWSLEMKLKRFNALTKNEGVKKKIKEIFNLVL